MQVLPCSKVWIRSEQVEKKSYDKHRLLAKVDNFAAKCKTASCLLLFTVIVENPLPFFVLMFGWAWAPVSIACQYCVCNVHSFCTRSHWLCRALKYKCTMCIQKIYELFNQPYIMKAGKLLLKRMQLKNKRIHFDIIWRSLYFVEDWLYNCTHDNWKTQSIAPFHTVHSKL